MPLKLIYIIIGALLLVIIIKITKNHFIKKTAHFIITLTIILIIILISLGLLTATGIIKSDNKYLVSGAAIAKYVKEDIKNSDIQNKSKNLVIDIKDNIK